MLFAKTILCVAGGNQGASHQQYVEGNHHGLCAYHFHILSCGYFRVLGIWAELSTLPV